MKPNDTLHNILDAPEQARLPSQFYTQKAYRHTFNSCIFFILGMLIGVLMNTLLIPKYVSNGVFGLLMVAALGFSITALLFAWKMVEYNEPQSAMKWTVLIGTPLLCLISSSLAFSSFWELLLYLQE